VGSVRNPSLAGAGTGGRAPFRSGRTLAAPRVGALTHPGAGGRVRRSGARDGREEPPCAVTCEETARRGTAQRPGTRHLGHNWRGSVQDHASVDNLSP
jgi:hypothetical protein